MSSNAWGNWRFFVPDKENTKCFSGTKNVVEWGVGALRGDLAEWNPRARAAPEAVTVG